MCEAKLKLSDEGRSCIQWWIDNVESSFKLIEIEEVNYPTLNKIIQMVI
jgi:hypothetical protein